MFAGFDLISNWLTSTNTAAIWAAWTAAAAAITAVTAVTTVTENRVVFQEWLCLWFADIDVTEGSNIYKAMIMWSLCFVDDLFTDFFAQLFSSTDIKIGYFYTFWNMIYFHLEKLLLYIIFQGKSGNWIQLHSVMCCISCLGS